MKKVFIIHGLGGSPNGGWRSWLMSELEKQDIYACALSMPNSENPICNDWIEEIARYVERNKNDEIYLIGHSLGATAILRYLDSTPNGFSIAGAVLVSGPCEKTQNEKIDNFLNKPFDFKNIQSKARSFVIIHGDNDDRVPLSHGEKLSQELSSELIVIKNGGHLNGRSGWTSLPQCLDALVQMMK